MQTTGIVFSSKRGAAGGRFAGGGMAGGFWTGRCCGATVGAIAGDVAAGVALGGTAAGTLPPGMANDWPHLGQLQIEPGGKREVFTIAWQ